MAQGLDAAVHPWHHRPLADHYCYLILDGVSVRIRLVGHVQRRVALCAYGITTAGRRELIDFLVVKGESEDTWKRLLLDLHRRGLHGAALDLITPDGQQGLLNAVASVWPRAEHQRCWGHKRRNLENRLKASQRACLEEAKLIYQAPHRQEALQQFRRWQARWQKVAPKAVAALAEDLEALLAFYDCPSEHGKRLRSTNVIERLFVEVRRRIRTMCAFTTPSSCDRILYSVFQRMNSYCDHRPLKAFTQNS